MMGFVWGLAGVLAGAFIALQSPINAHLARDLGFPLAAAAASFIAGAVVLVVLASASSVAQGVAIAWRAPPLWMFIAGGCLGAAYVTITIILTPKLGTAATMAFIVTGQLVGGLILDHFGYFGLAVREITVGRVGGAALLLAGALLIRLT
ncbi:bacterial/archaeal transporter family-2 protein [Hyphomicrobium sp. 1Nfss2.1]|uniref:DMT family transporter n=1 Tax=Hyphomicrobium sp. 1Nfss2.1 TaxID=3413936 RepID=UPI003C7B704E